MMQDLAPKEQLQARARNTRAQRYITAVIYYPLRISIVAFVMLPLSGGAISQRGGEGMASPLTHHVRDVTIYKGGCDPADCVEPYVECTPRCAECDWPPVCYVLIAIIIVLILLLLALLPKKPPAIPPIIFVQLIVVITAIFVKLRADAASFGLAQSIPLLDRAENEVKAEINKLK
jgi:hypothetical protein